MTDKSYDYVNNPDVLTIGCSQTSGVGLPFGWAWPEILKVSLGASINNCSAPGHGVPFLIDAAFEVMVKWGVPKKVYLLTPDFERLEVPNYEQENDIYQPLSVTWNYLYGAYFTDGEPVRLKTLEGKKATIPRELAIKDSIKSVRLLQRFCRINNIDMKVSSWVTAVVNFLQDLQIDDFIGPKPKNPECSGPEDFISKWYGLNYHFSCSHKPTNERQELLWDLADDNIHAGLHAQIHLAEFFSQKPVTQEHIKALS